MSVNVYHWMIKFYGKDRWFALLLNFKGKDNQLCCLCFPTYPIFRPQLVKLKIRNQLLWSDYLPLKLLIWYNKTCIKEMERAPGYQSFENTSENHRLYGIYTDENLSFEHVRLSLLETQFTSDKWPSCCSNCKKI